MITALTLMRSQQAYREGNVLPEVRNAADFVINSPIEEGLGESTALIYEQSKISFNQLKSRVARHGNALKAQGVGSGDRVLFLLDDQPDLVAAYLAAMKIGAVAVAYNIRATANDLKYAIENSQCKLLYVSDIFLDRYLDIEPSLESKPLVVVDQVNSRGFPSIEDFIAGQSDHLETAATRPSDAAFWIYTSGTTGKPKAAVHQHKDVAIAAVHVAQYQNVQAGERVMCTSKLFFAYSLGHILFGALPLGACVVLMKAWPDPTKTAELIAKQKPRVVYSVPAMYRNMLNAGAVTPDTFSSVRQCVSAGEKLPEQLFKRWETTTGLPIMEGIGCSEALIIFMANSPDSYRPGSCGKTVPWAKARLVDEHGAIVEQPDTPASLQIKHPALFDHYWQRPEQTQAAFDDGWYKTGDIFSVDCDGWWTHLGRNDDMLKISGQWVSPDEIEDLVREVAEVNDAAIVDITNESGLTRMALFVEIGEAAASSTEVDRLLENTRQHLNQNLPGYKIPRIIHFLNELPRTSTGKLRRFELREAL